MVEKTNNMFVVEMGDKNLPKLVMLHGLGGTHRYWNTGLETLTTRYYVIRIDLLGFGDSPQPWQNYTLEKHLDALEKVLSSYGSFVLMGHSLGAALSLGYAERHPQAVKALILLSLPLFYSQNEAYHWMRRTPSGWLMTNMGIAALTCMFTRRIAGKLLPYMLKEFPEEVVSDLVKHNVLSSITTLWNVLYHQSLIKNLKNLNKDLKVHCIHAINDATAPYKPVQQLVNEQSPWDLTLLEKSDHHPWLWDNQQCLDIIFKVMSDQVEGATI